MHCKWTGENMLNLDFDGVTSRQAILDALKEKVASTPAAEWIEGDGWNELIWEDGRPSSSPAASWTRSRPDNPLSPAAHVRPYGGRPSTPRALEEVGYTKDTPQPEGAEIGHYDDGELDGMLYENGSPHAKCAP